MSASEASGTCTGTAGPLLAAEAIVLGMPAEALPTGPPAETRMFFESVLRENKPITEFLNAKYTFLNELLAKH